MKKLFYIANIRFPTERAHGIQVAHMCSALARRHGTDAERNQRNQRGTHTERVAVTLLVPDRETFSEDPFSYYGVERNFTVEKIAVPDIVWFGSIGFFIESLVFAWRAARRIHKTVDIRCPQSLWTPDVYIYTREELPLLFLPRGRAFYEAHQIRRSPLFRWIIRRARRIIAITQGLKDALVRSGFPEAKILVAHDGYDNNTNYETDTKVRKGDVRRRLGLPQEGKIAMYIGGLESWKGAGTLCRSAQSLAKDNILVAIIGGTEKEIKRFSMDYPEVLFLGARPYRDLPQNQQAADVLVIPNSAQERISREFTSPLKLFAHMASGIPIVASRLPSLMEILSEENAYVVEPDNPSSFASGVLAALRDSAESEKKAGKAAVDVAPYSWDKRAKKILGWLLNRRSEKDIV